VWEVDKTRQVLMVVRDGQVLWIWNTSTGTEKPYTHNGVHHMADTPVGHYTFTRQIDGWRNGPLGLLYRPKYWHPDGLAIHGYSNVPPYPASHGCVRVINPAMDAIWSSGLAPIGTPIWIYGHSPGT
jgi:lipoprotein-anchoring transpeptidase ErfK/SrfK